jgi:hypothetical protein
MDDSANSIVEIVIIWCSWMIIIARSLKKNFILHYGELIVYLGLILFLSLAIFFIVSETDFSEAFLSIPKKNFFYRVQTPPLVSGFRIIILPILFITL